MRIDEIREYITDEIRKRETIEHVDMEDELHDIVDEVNKILGFTCEIKWIDWYDSPGYTAHYYAIAYVDKDGYLDIYEYTIELT